MQIKTMKWHYKPPTLAKINKTNTPNVGEFVSKWNS